MTEANSWRSIRRSDSARQHPGRHRRASRARSRRATSICKTAPATRGGAPRVQCSGRISPLLRTSDGEKRHRPNPCDRPLCRFTPSFEQLVAHVQSTDRTIEGDVLEAETRKLLTSRQFRRCARRRARRPCTRFAELRQARRCGRRTAKRAGDFCVSREPPLPGHLSNHRCGRAITAKRNYQIWTEGERKRNALGHATIAICGRMSQKKGNEYSLDYTVPANWGLRCFPEINAAVGKLSACNALRGDTF